MHIRYLPEQYRRTGSRVLVKSAVAGPEPLKMLFRRNILVRSTRTSALGGIKERIDQVHQSGLAGSAGTKPEQLFFPAEWSERKFL